MGPQLLVGQPSGVTSRPLHLARLLLLLLLQVADPALPLCTPARQLCLMHCRACQGHPPLLLLPLSLPLPLLQLQWRRCQQRQHMCRCLRLRLCPRLVVVEVLVVALRLVVGLLRVVGVVFEH